MGVWKSTLLSSVIDYLDNLGFQCYWAGKGRLWRVTGCFDPAVCGLLSTNVGSLGLGTNVVTLGWLRCVGYVGFNNTALTSTNVGSSTTAPNRLGPTPSLC